MYRQLQSLSGGKRKRSDSVDLGWGDKEDWNRASRQRHLDTTERGHRNAVAGDRQLAREILTVDCDDLAWSDRVERRLLASRIGNR